MKKTSKQSNRRTKTDRVTIGNATLYLGDCFDVLSKLDMELDTVISDMPYGVTDCDWDKVPPLDKFWTMIEKRAKPSANVVLFGCGKFSHRLYNSNPKGYRYDMIWVKNRRVGFLNANLMPMRSHESILVFGQPSFRKEAVYNAQKTPGGRIGTKKRNHTSSVYDNRGEHVHYSDGSLHPGSALYFKSDMGSHPTQKPLALMEFLVRSYSNENDIVLDCFMGSGSTGVAAINTGRRFIGIEREPLYFDIACKRIGRAYDERRVYHALWSSTTATGRIFRQC